MTTKEVLAILKQAQEKKISWSKMFLEQGYFQSEVDKVIKNLLRQGWVAVRMVPGGSRVELTISGIKKLEFYKLKEEKLTCGRWDRKWRMVMVTVPEKFRKKRILINGILAGWGMKEYYRGVWIWPWECKKQIENIKNILMAKENIRLLEVAKLEDERKWKLAFGL